MLHVGEVVQTTPSIRIGSALRSYTELLTVVRYQISREGARGKGKGDMMTKPSPARVHPPHHLGVRFEAVEIMTALDVVDRVRWRLRGCSALCGLCGLCGVM